MVQFISAEGGPLTPVDMERVLEDAKSGTENDDKEPASVEPTLAVTIQANTVEPTTETVVNTSTQDIMKIPENSNNLKQPPPSSSTTASDEIIRQQNMREDSSAITHDTQKTAKFEMDEDGFVSPVLSKKRPNGKLGFNVGEKIVSNRKTADDILLPMKKSDALQDFPDADTLKLIKTMEITHALSDDSLVKARLTRLKNKIEGELTLYPTTVTLIIVKYLKRTHEVHLSTALSMASQGGQNDRVES
ncbi:hypothetical protein QAD02_008669 [Eretmocerus hayati]|uniref:Uncharacterized protein n=1 Tax=Eretmocerus hayati TaxID=131215 RepID=A0ACC2N773_9HYME|nr:hypothetical protein QAD02_008669 [Eretmocerus hayati]